MAKIKIAVAGCLGRMGQEISKQVLKNWFQKNFGSKKVQKKMGPKTF